MKAEVKSGVSSVRPGCCRSLEKPGHQALKGQRRHAAREERGQPEDRKTFICCTLKRHLTLSHQSAACAGHRSSSALALLLSLLIVFLFFLALWRGRGR